MSDAPRFSVSYRRAWWDPRRLYACGNVVYEEAAPTAAYLGIMYLANPQPSTP